MDNNITYMTECISDLLDRFYGYRPRIKFVFKRGLKYPRGFNDAYTKTIYIYLTKNMFKGFKDVILYLILHELKHLLQLRDKYKNDIKKFLNDYKKEIFVISKKEISQQATPLEWEAIKFGMDEAKREDIKNEFMKCLNEKSI